MEKLLHQDSVFWVVKPQVGREGISGLGTLLSGAYIELQPGTKGFCPGAVPAVGFTAVGIP
ncbi:paraquat-inducible protein B [Klebsiella grimontii]|uniref:Paraquat-inducible protein B n=1 Tax=Klebsiella grimontii TaxID=2058152 RepID=A0A7H4P6U9_9ENTR|nr:paraquat-inducible protein B [Klebsiella grimontii]